MRIELSRFTLGIGAFALAAVIAGSYATGASQADSVGTPEERISALEAKAMNSQAAGVAYATYLLDNAGLHGIDDSVKAGEIKAGSLGNVRKARIVAAATDWPADLAPKAKELVAHLTALQAALEKEDVAAAKDPAHEAHDAAHDFSDAVYGWLAKSAGVQMRLSGAAAPAAAHGAAPASTPSGDHGSMPGDGHSHP